MFGLVIWKVEIESRLLKKAFFKLVPHNVIFGIRILNNSDFPNDFPPGGGVGTGSNSLNPLGTRLLPLCLSTPQNVHDKKQGGGGV